MDIFRVYFIGARSLPVEFGTSRMEAQPYMRPAIDNKQQEALKAIGDQIEAEIRKAL